MAVRNGAKWIRPALDSFVMQSDPKELIVIDQGSDEVEQIVKDYPARYFKSDTIGCFQAMNEGLKYLREGIFVTLDCDNRLLEKSFDIVREEIGDFGWLYGDMVLIDENEKVISFVFTEPFNLDVYCQRNIVPNTTAYVKTEHMTEFNLAYPYNADYDFFLRLAHRTKPKQIHRYLAKHMMRTGSLSTSHAEIATRDRKILRQKVREEFYTTNADN
jgi:glycosyltransferase involved in cell wall biosynthesis